MAEIVNLRQARKAKTREEKKKQASDNRLRFGRPKAETVAAKKERDRQAGILEAHRRSPDTPDE